MVERDRRFFFKVPPGYHEMSEAEQKVAALEMWRDVMTQLGEDPDRLVTENAQDECHGHQV